MLRIALDETRISRFVLALYRKMLEEDTIAYSKQRDGFNIRPGGRFLF